MKCPKCSSVIIVKNGKQSGKQRYKCKECSNVFQEKNPKYTSDFKMECIKIPIIYDEKLYKKRNSVEHFFKRLNTFRKIATRYEHTANSFLSMIKLKF